MEGVILFIANIALCSWWIFGVRTLFSGGHILEKADNWVYDRVPEYIYKPTIGCVMCMASLHGATWFMLFLYPTYELYMVIPFCLCLCGLNSITDNLTD